MFVAGPAGGLEAGVGEFFAQHFERNSVLQRQRDGGGEAVHQAGDGGAFFGHLDEDFAGLAAGVEADGDVAFVPGQREFMGERGALLGETVAHGAGWGVGVLVLRGWRNASRACSNIAEPQILRFAQVDSLFILGFTLQDCFLQGDTEGVGGGEDAAG